MLEDWLKEVAPSGDLRRWFGHDPQKWDEFPHAISPSWTSKPDLAAHFGGGPQAIVTLVYRDTEHNDTIALKAYLENELAATIRTTTR